MGSKIQGMQFTWHVGSIRPYASLWHTILRIAALNSLRSGELPEWPVRMGAPTESVHTISPLHNSYPVINTDALANSLGEEPSVFRWSHFGALAPWLRNVVTPGYRLCRDCLEQGYHSALFSLKLIDTCPIHSTPLLERCKCERLFRESISPSDFMRQGYCECYEQCFFTKETCRSPTLDKKLTAVFDPIVTWLEKISLVPRYTFQNDEYRSDAQRNWLADLFELNNALELEYPNGLLTPIVTSPRHLTRTYSGHLPRHMASIKGAAPPPVDRSYWKGDPATWTYRALSRYVRRHVFRGGEPLGTRLISETGKLQRFKGHGADAHTLFAFAEILWANHVEFDVLLRRWPHRDPRSTGARSFIDTDTQARIDIPWPSMDQAVRPWLQYQVAGVSMMTLWQKAIERANEISIETAATARTSFMDIFIPFEWSATVQQDGRVLFTSLGSEVHHFLAIPRHEKGARIERVQKATEKTRLNFLENCSGPCLTWTESDGWHVAEAASPKTDHDMWRRHKLLGICGPKQHFWIFTNGDQFVARLCSERLQTFAPTASEAINSLRRCVKQYIKTYRGSPLTVAINAEPNA